MTTETLTLTDFLLARIAEDEEFADGCGKDPADDSAVRWDYTRATDAALLPFRTPDLPDGVLVRSYQHRDPVEAGDWIIATHWEEDGEHIARHDPARVLAECAAKRQIVEDFEILHADYRAGHDPTTEARRFQARVAMSRLASVYADHMDYREEWRP